MDPITTTFILTMVLPGVIGKCIDVSTNRGLEYWTTFTVPESAITEFVKNLPSHQTEVADALRKWIRSESFVREARSVKGWSLADAVNSFSKASGLSSSPIANLSLEELVSEYLVEFAIQLSIVDPVMRAKETRAQFLQLMAKVSALEQVVERKSDEILLRLAQPKLNSVLSYEVHEPEERLAEETSIHSQIDVAIAHLNRGKVCKARDELIKIREHLDTAAASISDYIVYRIAGCLGDCYTSLEVLEEAKTEYQTALNAKATRLNYSNLAAALLNLNENAEALRLSRKAMNFPKTNGRTVSIHMHALKQNGLDEELAEFLTEHQDLCDSDPDCLFARGQIAYDEKDYCRANSLFTKASERVPYNGQLKLLSANCLLKIVETPLFENTPLDGKLSSESSTMMQEAKLLIEDAIEALVSNDHFLLRNRALEYRACIAFFEQDFDSAESDCRKVLETDPQNQIALLKLGCIAAMRNDHEQAIHFYESVSSEQLRTMTMMVAVSYVAVGNMEKAKERLREFENIVDKRKLFYVYAHESLKIAVAEGTLEKTIGDLLDKYRTTGDVLFAIAEIYKKRGMTKETLHFLDAAEGDENCTLATFIQRARAQTYVDAGLWDAAVNAFEAMCNFRNYKQDWYEYITALANTDNNALLGTAGVEAKNARIANGGKVIPVISEIEASAELFKFNRPREALSILLELWKINPIASTEKLIRTANQRIGRESMDLNPP